MSTVEYQSTQDVFLKDLTEISNPENSFLSAFKSLEEGYNEMKESLNIPISNKGVFSQLAEGFKQIQDIIDGVPETEIDNSSLISIRKSLKEKAYKV